MRRGEVPFPDDDAAADRYLAAEGALTAAGFTWYEISNWAKGTPCRHNELYWTGGDWWGLGPGAHSHVGGVRWWNVKHPRTYAERLAGGGSPGQAREVLTGAERHTEDVLLRIRLAAGLEVTALDEAGRAGAAGAVDDGLLDAGAFAAGRAVLTLRGRLLADAVTRALLP
jgi:oxygen-independent coproporphyrinogen-3 oxidase